MPAPTLEDAKKHFSYLGQILSQLQSIEYLLRWWLATTAGIDVILPTHIGQQLAETPITDYRSLRPLIDDYNNQLNSSEAPFGLDHRIVEIRDSLAHGRILALSDEVFYTLYRFSRPTDGQVNAIAIKKLSDEILEGDLVFLREQFERILQCGSGRGYFNGVHLFESSKN